MKNGSPEFEGFSKNMGALAKLVNIFVVKYACLQSVPISVSFSDFLHTRVHLRMYSFVQKI